MEEQLIGGSEEENPGRAARILIIGPGKSKALVWSFTRKTGWTAQF
jgi:hypothetical protein